MPQTSFEEELRILIIKHSMENESDTPDFLLARFMLRTLNAFNAAVKKRDEWWGFKPWAEDKKDATA